MKPMLILLAFLLCTACTSATPTPIARPLPFEVQPAIAHGLAFLKTQYKPEHGLLQESPHIGQQNYFLANDALLAQRVFALNAEQALADSLAQTLDHYGIRRNDFIEAAWGEPIPWPPRHFEDPGTLVTTAGDARIMTIWHDGPGYFYDWSAYSNLAFMAAVNEWNQGHVEAARRLYELEMGTFDGHGFADEAYWNRDGVYETLGLAWGVYAAGLMCIRPDEAMLRSLLLRQDPASGGFHTHYSSASERLADPNVETTSIALLALHAIQQTHCRPPTRAQINTPQQAAYCHTVRRAVGFLTTQYDPAFGLLRESPVTAPDKHWLATDNRLALAALRSAAPCAPDATPLAIEQGLASYGDTRHGLIEAVTGGSSEWPPRTATQTSATPGVWREERLTGSVMEDWREYADLAFYGVIHLAQSGQINEARTLYAETLAMFDTTGFVDKANREGQPYATYKLALAIIAADAVGEPPDAAVLAQLLDKQDKPGGFFAHYDAGGGLNDANTETTAYSILALMGLSTPGNP